MTVDPDRPLTAATPPGYCHACGYAPATDPGMYRVLHRPGGVDCACSPRPRDPAGLILLAVQQAIQDDLNLGHGTPNHPKPGVLLHPAMASRVMALVTETVGIYTAEDPQ
jgi:hypothetical protein